MSIAVTVLTISRVARNSGGAARQESRPQSATEYSSVRFLVIECRLFACTEQFDKAHRPNRC